MRVLALDGDGWQIRGCLGEEWRWYLTARTPPDAPGWFPARVPGSVIDDLWRAGEVPDPYAGRNSRLLEWVPARAWLYRRRFTLAPLAAGERAVLCFDGVDHAAEVYLDGQPVTRHAGAYLPFTADVTEHVAAGGEHLLAVLVEPAPPSEPQVGVTGRVRVHKSRMGYGWDFCPRMVHQGVWRPVRLEVTGTPRLTRLAVRTRVAGGLAGGSVTVDAELDAPAPVTVTVRDAGRVVSTERVVAAERVVATERAEVAAAGQVVLAVPAPRLWWPNGVGPQHRYQVEVVAGEACRRFEVGFRRLELAGNDGAPSGARPYTLVVNGERVYINGWNWVPVDALYGVPNPGKLDHLLTLARDGHVNLLRVWGGGLIETPEFYRRCDRLGLLVWQEFSMSSSGMASVPAADDEFVTMMVDQARQIVPALAHHPALAIWCGGNELADGEVPLDDSAPVLAALKQVTGELAPACEWLPSSPSGPAFGHRLDAIRADPAGQHDVHGPWEHQGVYEHYPLYDAGTCLLHSEFGVEGMTNRRTLDALVAPADRWPAGRSNPVYAHLGAWWNNEALVQASFGHRLTDLDSLGRASQLLQADGLRYAVEANRRRAWRSSGTIPWQFNESYPNAWCTSAVDHRGDPKPAYHAVRRSYRRWHPSARLARQVWAGQDTFRAGVWVWAGGPGRASVTARVVDGYGTVAARRRWTAAAAGEGPVELGGLDADLAGLGSDVFLLDLACQPPGGAAEVGNRYLLSRTRDLSPLLDLERSTVDAKLTVVGDGWLVTLGHRAGPAAFGLTLTDNRHYHEPGWAVPDDNGLDLLPGEARTVAVDWRGAPAASRTLLLTGWNIEALDVR